MFFFDPNYVMIANNPAIVPRSFVRPPKNVVDQFPKIPVVNEYDELKYLISSYLGYPV